MRDTIYNSIKVYTNKHVYPFHMPGHKRNISFWQDGLFPTPLLELDFTELEGLDNLHSPHGIIREAEKKIAGIYGADESRLLINGSTAGLIAALGSVCKQGDYVLAGRNSHKSLYGGLVFSGAAPIYILPEITSYGLFGGYDYNKIEKALAENNDIKAVFITSPTYEGFVSDIRRIAKVTHSAGRVLIVDEAHGAHFAFGAAFPYPAVQCGADIVINSLHKTMPALNQSALLHVSGKRVDISLIDDMLRIIQTTSPSYIMMASMERTVDFLTGNSRCFRQYTDRLRYLRENLAANKNIELITESIIGDSCISDIDIGKIVLHLSSDDLTGLELYEELSSRYKLQLEMNGFRHALAMTGVADDYSSYTALLKAVAQIDIRLKSNANSFNPTPVGIIPKMIYTPRESFYMPKRMIDASEAAGQICGKALTPYPPGSPLVIPGELISGDMIKQFFEYYESGVTVLGAEGSMISILDFINK